MKKALYVIITALTVTILLAGCTAATEKQPPKQPIQQQLQQPDAVKESDSAVEVSSVKELLEAIKPGAEIILKDGYYNISEYVAGVWQDNGNESVSISNYVKLSECHDGVEVIIERADGFVIRGGKNTEIVTKPRYAAVLNFTDCRDIELSSLIMGHTDAGDCSGNVINFSNCKNLLLDSMDIYGCGVYGIGAYNGTDGLYVYNSTIRDCYGGPLEIYGCSGGKFEFTDCIFRDSLGFGYIEDEKEMYISFYGCEFGEKETGYFMFSDNINTENCTFSEYMGEYPEFGYENESIGTDFQNMKQVAFDKEVLDGTSWHGVYSVNTENGFSYELPSMGDDGAVYNISVLFGSDGTGIFDYYGLESTFTWYCDSDYTVCIEKEDGDTAGIMHVENAEGEHPLSLLIHVGETAVWMQMD